MNQKFLLLIGILLLAGFAIYRMLFSPISVTFMTSPSRILTNSSTPIVVDVFQINRLGFRIPFRHLDGKFVVNEGKEKIIVLQEKGDEFIFKTQNNPGTIVILYYAHGVPFPVQIFLKIEGASLAAITNHLSFSFG